MPGFETDQIIQKRRGLYIMEPKQIIINVDSAEGKIELQIIGINKIDAFFLLNHAVQCMHEDISKRTHPIIIPKMTPGGIINNG